LIGASFFEIILGYASPFKSTSNCVVIDYSKTGTNVTIIVQSENDNRTTVCETINVTMINASDQNRNIP